MKKFLIFIGGFILGILAAIFASNVFTRDNKPNDGDLLGLTLSRAK